MASARQIEIKSNSYLTLFNLSSQHLYPCIYYIHLILPAKATNQFPLQPWVYRECQPLVLQPNQWRVELHS